MALQNITQLFTNTFLADSPLTKTLGEEFVLCENGNIIFHWADFHETCDMIKTQLESDSNLMQDFQHREHALGRLGLIPVWVRTENRVHQATMLELYEKFILNQSHLLGGVDPFCPLDISFISGTGPFKSMSIAECFNKSTYRDFILVYLLQGRLPKRDFRIRLRSKILLEYGTGYGQAELVSLEQLTMNGLLISIDSDVYMKKVADQESIRILVNSKMLQEGKDKSLVDLKNHLSQYAFNLLYSSSKDDSIVCRLKDFQIQSSFDFSKSKKVYLFVSYDKLDASHPSSVKNIRDFVAMTKELVKDHYAQRKEQKTA